MILGEDWIAELDANADALGMTQTMLCWGGKAPEDLDENRLFHQQLVDDLAGEARKREWPGAEFCFYMRREGYVSIYIAPSRGGVLSISGLTQHREAQKASAQRMPTQQLMLV